MASATGLPASSSTSASTKAVHVPPWLVVEPSRSPTCDVPRHPSPAPPSETGRHRAATDSPVAGETISPATQP